MSLVWQSPKHSEHLRKMHWCGSTQRLPCVKGAVSRVSRKRETEGLSEWVSSDPLSPSVRTGAAPLGQQGEPFRSAGSSRNIRGIATPVCGLVRNDMHLTGLVRNDMRYFKRAYFLRHRRSLLIPQRKTGDFLWVFPIEKGKWVWYTDSRIWKKKVFL